VIEIRKAEARDLPAIAEIQDASPESAPWKPEFYLEVTTWIASLEGQIVAFLAMRSVMPDEHELLNLAVAPEHRRKGIARTLLDYAKRQGPGLWFLEVRESNTAARTFYKSYGFIDFGKRKGYYQEPYEDAIVMRF
jgi:[ribosomal protein S18]-alanine N-acetyltransferase